MEVALSEERALMLETARRIGAEYGLDYWRALDEQGAYPSEMWQAICAAGFGGIALPEEYGGAGLGMLDQALVIEALCEAGAGATLAQIFMLNPIFGGVAIARYGTQAMRRALLPPLIAGDLQCCMALTEPDAGSNTLELRTFAEAHGNGWRLNGRKIWISAVPTADKMLVVARTKKVAESERRSDGISLFLIDVAREGLREGHPLSRQATSIRRRRASTKAGWTCSPERIVRPAGWPWGLRWTTPERTVFGERPVSSYQGLQFPLAQAKAEIECAAAMNGRRPARCRRRRPTWPSSRRPAEGIGARCTMRHGLRQRGTWSGSARPVFRSIPRSMILNYTATTCGSARVRLGRLGACGALPRQPSR